MLYTSKESPITHRLQAGLKLEESLSWQAAGSTQVFVKVVLFQLRRHGHAQNDAMPNIFPDSKSLLLELSNEVSFVSEFLWDGG